MPTIYEMRLPEPANWQEFELITKDAMQVKWQSPTLQRNGRAGQWQNGVDIYGPDQLGRPVAIQCKNTVGELSFKTIEDEVRNAEKFTGRLSTLFIATTAKMDAQLQKDVRVLSEKRVGQDKFAVGLLYWEDIFSGLALDDRLLRSHYPNIVLGSGATAGTPAADRLSGLTLGYYGGYVWRYVELIFGEAGEWAQEDPEQLRTIVRMLKVNARVLSQEDAKDIRAWATSLEDLLFEPPKLLSAEDRLDQIKATAQTLENRARYLASLVEDVAVASFIEIGLALGKIYHSDSDFNVQMAAKVHRAVSSMLPSSTGPLVELLAALQEKPTYRAGPALYTFVDRELRFPAQGTT